MVTKDWSKISDRIAQAETKTSAEIAVSIIATSGNYDHVRWLLTFVSLSALLLLGVDTYIDTHHLPFAWPAGAGLVIVMVAAAALGGLLSRVSILKRWCTSSAKIDRWAALRAEVELFERIHGQTQGKTGVLVFVSLTEHRALILADKPVMATLSQDFLNQTLTELLQHLGKRELEAGLVQTVSVLGASLAKTFPVQPGDRNEVCNQVVFKEQ